MKVLLVCVFKEDLVENAAPFVIEQKKALQRCGVECDLFLVKGKGIHGYLRQLRPLKKKIADYQPDVIHAHYGLCGLLANLQRSVPVVNTYHGSDINDPKVLKYSKMAMFLSAWDIFVSRKALEIAKPQKKYSLLPCGVDLTELQLTTRKEARIQMHLEQERRYVLFAGAFDNAVKNASLAIETVKRMGETNVELLELKGYSRDEVTLLMCAADAMLMTSLSEGSPQVIKEALACGCPIVSVDVGDVKERIHEVKGCYVSTSFDPDEIVALLKKALSIEGGKTNGREKILSNNLDNRQVANDIISIYNIVLNNI